MDRQVQTWFIYHVIACVSIFTTYLWSKLFASQREPSELNPTSLLNWLDTRESRVFTGQIEELSAGGGRINLIQETYAARPPSFMKWKKQMFVYCSSQLQIRWPDLLTTTSFTWHWCQHRLHLQHRQWASSVLLSFYFSSVLISFFFFFLCSSSVKMFLSLNT